jgi:hypothetical protein
MKREMKRDEMKRMKRDTHLARHILPVKRMKRDTHLARHILPGPEKKNSNSYLNPPDQRR